MVIKEFVLVKDISQRFRRSFGCCSQSVDFFGHGNVDFVQRYYRCALLEVWVFRGSFRMMVVVVGCIDRIHQLDGIDQSHSTTTSGVGSACWVVMNGRRGKRTKLERITATDGGEHRAGCRRKKTLGDSDGSGNGKEIHLPDTGTVITVTAFVGSILSWEFGLDLATFQNVTVHPRAFGLLISLPASPLMMASMDDCLVNESRHNKVRTAHQLKLHASGRQSKHSLPATPAAATIACLKSVTIPNIFRLGR